MKIKKELNTSSKLVSRLNQKVKLRDNALKLKSVQLKEYLNEIEHMRERVAEVEGQNQSLRVTFDRTISSLESKVEKQKE